MKYFNPWVFVLPFIVNSSLADENTDIVDFWANGDYEQETLMLLAPFAQTMNNAAIIAEANTPDVNKKYLLSDKFLQAIASPDLKTNISSTIDSVGADKVVEALNNSSEGWDSVWGSVEQYYPELAVIGEGEVKKFSVGSLIASSGVYGEKDWMRKIEDTSIYLCFWIIACPPPPPPIEGK